MIKSPHIDEYNYIINKIRTSALSNEVYDFVLAQGAQELLAIKF